MKYIVVDFYEEPVVVGYADSMKEAKELESTWHEDTDGECITEILTTVYNRAESDDFYAYDKATKEFDKLVSQLPDKVWIS